MTGIRVGRRFVNLPPSALAFDPATGAGTIFDSGTMVTRLVAPAYAAVRDEFRKRIKLPVSSLGGYDTCFTEPFVPPTISFHFDGMFVTLPRENVVIDSSFGTTTCLAMAAAPDNVNSVVNVIASYQQQNHRVLYDVANSRIDLDCNLLHEVVECYNLFEADLDCNLLHEVVECYNLFEADLDCNLLHEKDDFDSILLHVHLWYTVLVLESFGEYLKANKMVETRSQATQAPQNEASSSELRPETLGLPAIESKAYHMFRLFMVRFMKEQEEQKALMVTPEPENEKATKQKRKKKKNKSSPTDQDEDYLSSDSAISWSYDRKFTPLSQCREKILEYLLAKGTIVLPKVSEPPKMMGGNKEKLCKFHPAPGHDTEDCFVLKNIIQDFINKDLKICDDSTPEILRNPFPDHGKAVVAMITTGTPLPYHLQDHIRPYIGSSSQKVMVVDQGKEPLDFIAMMNGRTESLPKKLLMIPRTFILQGDESSDVSSDENPCYLDILSLEERMVERHSVQTSKNQSITLSEKDLPKWGYFHEDALYIVVQVNGMTVPHV
ncbi:hypothetical protein EJ110_NYTH25619 [Nymphaea thermarum]|nr:hypothetical protein EJ110_NYTH25619 [Nymphaea thermarum]